MIYIAVLEDNEKDRAMIAEALKYVEEKENVSFSIKFFPNAMSFFVEAKYNYDIVLFDIEMPEMNGLEAAKKFRSINKCAVILFVTNMAQYALEGYQVNALDFIIKPIQKYEFALKMNRTISNTQKQTEKSILVGSEGETYVIPIRDICYIEVQGHYIIYHTLEAKYSEYSTLKDAEKKISNTSFVRCNRCYLVNLRFVRSIKKDIVVVNGDELIISRPQKKQFINALSDFISGGVS